MSWRDFKNSDTDTDKLSDLINIGKQYQEHTKDMHKENPGEWKKTINRRK